jgi:uncharacterized membrane protein YdbT with pleckstrin-like domain
MPYADTLLATNERILRRERQHWMFPLLVAGRWVAIAAIIGVLGFLLTQLTGGDGFAGIIDQILTWGTVIALAFAAIGLIYSIVQWQTQEYVLSDRRVMHVHGVINKQSSDASLENITDAQITVPWLGRIMGFGDLIFLTAAEAGMQNLKTLKSPIEFKKDLMDAKHERMIDINTPRVASPPIRTDAAPAPVAPPPPAAPPKEDPEELTRTLTSLAALRDSGAITPEEYEAKKSELLARL